MVLEEKKHKEKLSGMRDAKMSLELRKCGTKLRLAYLGGFGSGLSLTHCSSAGVAQFFATGNSQVLVCYLHHWQELQQCWQGKGWQALLPMQDWLLMLCGQFRS